MAHPIANIVIRKRMRKVDPKKVDQLVESISTVGLLQPIILNRNILVAGAHRLAAMKKLGRVVIPFVQAGDCGDLDTLKLAEIDENLFRNELSPAERAGHIALRTEILAKRKLPEKTEEVKANYKAQRQNVEDSDKVCQKVQQGANHAANAEAKKEVAEILGTQVTHVNAEIKNHEAVTKANLDVNDLEELNGTQFKRVAQVAKQENMGKIPSGSAAKEVAEQLDKCPKESVVAHDPMAVLKQDISVLVSARSLTKRVLRGKSDPVRDAYADDAYEALDALISHLKKDLTK